MYRDTLLHDSRQVQLSQHIKSYNLKELAALYEESPKTIRAWLRPHEKAIGPQVGRKYTPKQTAIIFKKLGLPSKISVQFDDFD